MEGRALIADGDVGDCRLIEEVMTESQLSSIVVHDGQAAASLLKGEKFSVLIFDLLASSVGGIELTKAARLSGPNQMTPIVVISSDQDPSGVGRSFEAGANFFLYKPLDRSRLLSLLRATQGSVEQEKRRFRRVPLQLKMKLAYESQEFEAETINVSLNGVLVRADAGIPTGSRVGASIQLTGDPKPIECQGTIMRALGANRVGILLDHVKPEDNVRLQDFLLPLIEENATEHVLKA